MRRCADKSRMAKGNQVKRSALLTALMVAFGVLSSTATAASAQPAPVAGPSCFTPTNVGDAQRPRDTLVATKAMVARAQRHVDAAKRKAVFGSGRVPSTVEVPVYANIIKGRHVRDRRGHSRERVSIAEIQESIAILNEAFAGGQSATNHAVGLHFNLVDIRFKKRDRWFHAVPDSAADIRMRRALHRGGRDALNLYFTRPRDDTLGSSAFPWDYKVHPRRDGITIGAGTVPGGNTKNYNLGDTLVHEVGHWVGLFHTFEFGCDAENDMVADTPQEADPGFGCPEGADTCADDPGADPIHNFMDYTQDSCMNMFTWGQTDRMTRAWAYFRAPAV